MKLQTQTIEYENNKVATKQSENINTAGIRAPPNIPSGHSKMHTLLKSKWNALQDKLQSRPQSKCELL